MCRIFLLLFWISSAFSYKILFFSPTISRSHMISNGRYADELAKAGHDVVMFEPDYLNIFEKVKAAEVAKRWPLKGFSSAFYDVVSGFSNDILADASIFRVSWDMIRYIQVKNDFCKQVLDNDDIMEKLRAEKFDAYFGEQLHFCGQGIAHSLGIKSLFMIHSCPMSEYTNWYLGQPTPLSYVMPFGVDSDPSSGYFSRAYNVFAGTLGLFVGYWSHLSTAKIFWDKYGPDFPHVGEIAADSDFVFVSTDEYIDLPRPVLPNMVNTGGLGLSDASTKPLGEIFEKEMQKGEKGVIYFSLGTVVNTTKVPEVMEAVVTVAKNFPSYHFIARAEQEDLHSRKVATDVPNLSIFSWIPQAALLLHPRLKIFMNHAGYNGIMEAAKAAVPMITIPFLFDQPSNSRAMKASGWSIHVPKSAIRDDHQRIVSAVREILENDRYKQTALRIQKLIKEKPFNATERLVRTVEFVVANGGVKELLTAGRRMSITHLYNLDVILPFALALFVFTSILTKLIARIFCKKERRIKQKTN